METLEKQVVTPTKFALILGVNRSTVSRAIKNGRLKTSLRPIDDDVFISVYDGCVEWYLKKQASKDRFKNSPEIEKSRAVREHYRSLLTKIDYKIKSGSKVCVHEVSAKGAEICLNARKYLEDRRDRDAIKLPLLDDDFEVRKLLKERDDGFLNHLIQLETVAQEVAKIEIEEQEDAEELEDDVDDE